MRMALSIIHLALATLLGLAGTLAASGEPEQAAELFGATIANYESAGIVMFAGERLEFERDRAIVGEALDEETLARAWRRGQEMKLEQAIEYALACGT